MFAAVPATDVVPYGILDLRSPATPLLEVTVWNLGTPWRQRFDAAARAYTMAYGAGVGVAEALAGLNAVLDDVLSTVQDVVLGGTCGLRELGITLPMSLPSRKRPT